MKKFRAFFLAALTAAALTLSAGAAEILLEPAAVTMVPLRAVAEELGYTVAWDGSLPGARLTRRDKEAVLVLGQSSATLIDYSPGGDPVMGNPLPMSAAPAFLAPGTIYVPLDFFHSLIGDATCVTVSDSGLISVTINTTPTIGETQIPNPIRSHEAADMLKAAVGFDFTVPEAPVGFAVSGYQDINGTVAEVRWTDDIQELAYRINRGGSTSSDNSGDYTLYPASGSFAVNGVTVHWRGEAGRIRVASWATEGFIHSIWATEGLAEVQLRPMVGDTLA